MLSASLNALQEKFDLCLLVIELLDAAQLVDENMERVARKLMRSSLLEVLMQFFFKQLHTFAVNRAVGGER